MPGGLAVRRAGRYSRPEPVSIQHLQEHVMSDPSTDVLAIGNAIVDVIAPCADETIEELGMARGGMMLIDTDRARALYDAMGPGREISGGSAANTLAGLAALGAKCAFIGQVADDQLGEVFAHDIRAAGIDFGTAPRPGDPPTARCLIFVTPDGQRTLNTYLGASQYLPAAALDEAAIADSAILYLEGYLWDPQEPRAAMKKAIAAAKGAGRKVAFTLSDGFVIERHGADFRAMVEAGEIDILFANEAELAAMTGESDFETGLAQLSPKVPVLVVTRSEKGAVALSGGERAAVSAEPIGKVVDTTGAGDLFASGFLFGHVRGRPLQDCLRMGAICAWEIISHYGARPEADLKALLAETMG
jgi:sugar/nucleoside kinase (ribokinase family)